MAIWQGRSKKTPSGARFKMSRGKRKAELGREPTATKLGDISTRKSRTRGGNQKIRLTSTNKVNVVNTETNKTEVVEVYNVIENKSNPNFVRMNIITKGAVLETSAGKVKVTSRPGQHGVLDGVLLKE